MWRAHEAALANDVARLNRWIAEAESLASRATDEETLRFVEADLARWYQSRDRSDVILGRARFFNRWTSWSLRTFWFCFVLLCGIALPFSSDEIIYLIFAAALVLLVIASGASYLAAITVRDAMVLGRRPLHFSLRNLLTAMTIIALLLGLWFFAVRS